jgi:hypothetical protein
MFSLFRAISGLFMPIDNSSTFVGLYDDIHVPQEFLWDCGIATSSMVLRWYKKTKGEEFIDTPLEWEDATPLWTIDLFVFLKNRGVSAVMSTSVRGIEPGHSDIEWYSEHMDKDRERVMHLFKLAEQKGWAIEDPVSTHALTKALNNEEERVAIVLINSNNLIPRGGVDQSKYAGHYILLLFYDDTEDEFVYLDPAKSTSCAKRVSSEALERSRQSNGTDQDLILCERLTKRH